MASTKIRGITIELGADTSGLSSALKTVNSDIGTTQRQLKDVNNLLKLDPTNTQLLEQKQRLLGERITQTKDKLSALKKAQEQVAVAMEKTGEGQAQYDALTREIAQCEQELKRLEKEASASNVTLSKVKATADKISTSAGAVASKMTPVTVALTAVGTASVKLASDVEESTNKVEVAFGDSAESVKQFAETTLESYGIARGTALDMASLFGDMATSMGLSQSEASSMSTTLVGLAGDMASFKNVSLDVAQNALKGIFTGETESLKSLGIVMNETTLDAYAMSQGFRKGTDGMTEAQKVSLRYQYVLEKTKNAQGDFARTSDGTANSLRIFQESLKELGETFGAVLLPIITPIIQKLSDMVQKFGDLDPKIQKVVVTFGLLVACIAPVAGIISAVAGAVSAVTAVLGAMPAVIGAVTIAVNALTVAFDFLLANPIVLIITAIIAAIVLLGVAIYQLIKNWDAVVASFNKFKKKLQDGWTELKKHVSDVVDKMKANVVESYEKIQDRIANTIARIKGYWNAFKGFWVGLWDSIKEIASSIWGAVVDAVKAPINAIIGFLNKAINSINGMIDSINNINIKLPQALGGGEWSPHIGKISEIPMLATGGVVSSGSAIVGEAGAELLSVQNGQATVQPLTSTASSNTSNLQGLLEQYLPYLAERQNLYLDGNTLVGGTASRMNDALGRIAIRGGAL